MLDFYDDPVQIEPLVIVAAVDNGKWLEFDTVY